MGILTSKFGIYLGLVVVGLIALAIIARNWSCRAPRPPRPPKIVTLDFEVVSFPNGATIEIKFRRNKTRLVHLENISCPMEGDVAIAARENLELSCGKSGRVEYQRKRIFGDQDDETAGDQEVELGGDITGVCFGASGINLQIDQLEHGWADCSADAPDDWKTIRNESKNLKRGIWRNEKPKEADELTPLTPEEFEHFKLQMWRLSLKPGMVVYVAIKSAAPIEQWGQKYLKGTIIKRHIFDENDDYKYNIDTVLGDSSGDWIKHLELVETDKIFRTKEQAVIQTEKWTEEINHSGG